MYYITVEPNEPEHNRYGVAIATTDKELWSQIARYMSKRKARKLANRLNKQRLKEIRESIKAKELCDET